MVQQWLHYFLIRLYSALMVFGLFFCGFFLVLYRLGYEAVYTDEFVLGALILAPLISHGVVTLWGRLLLRRLSAQAHWLSRLGDERGAQRAFEQIRQVLFSWYFFPPHQKRLWTPFAIDYAKTCLGANRTDSVAKAVYEELLEIAPGQTVIEEALVDLYEGKLLLSEEEIVLSERLLDRHPDDPRLLKRVAGYYLDHQGTHFDAERVIWRAYQRGLVEAERIGAVLLPRILEARRQDDQAVRFYLLAIQQDKSNQRLAERIQQVADLYRRRGRRDELAQQVLTISGSLPQLTPSGTTTRDTAAGPIPVPSQPAAVGATESSTEPERYRYHSPVQAEPVEPPDRQPFPSGILVGRWWVAIQRAKLGQTVWGWLQSIGSWLIWHRVWPVLVGGVGVLLVVVVIGRFWFGNAGENGHPAQNRLQAYETTLPFTIQIGAFKNQADAEALVLAMRAKGEKAYWQEAKPTQRGTVFYRVRIGDFPTRVVAGAYVNRLKQEGLVPKDSFVANFEGGFYPVTERE